LFISEVFQNLISKLANSPTLSYFAIINTHARDSCEKKLYTMKKFLLLTLVIVLTLSGCSEKYDDTALWNSVNDLEQRMSAVETVMNAYKNNLFIRSVVKTIDGYSITFSDGSIAQITNGKDGTNGQDGEDGKDGVDGQDGTNGTDGKDGVPGKDGENGKDGINGQDGKDGTNGKDGEDGKDGDTLIASIVVGTGEVTFTLTDGTTFSIPIGAPLSIAFETDDLVGMLPSSTRNISYTVSSLITPVVVETNASPDIKVKVVPADKSGLTGKIQITTGSVIDSEYSKVVVFVSNGDKVVMRAIYFEEAGLQVEEEITKEATAEGGEVALEFLSNTECEAVIPQSARSWISVVPQTRALEKQTITLKLEPNTGYDRSAVVRVQSTDGSLFVEYTVEQEGAVASPLSVQSALSTAITEQNSVSTAQFISANYDPDLKYVVVTYKVGTIKNIFLQYLSNVVVAAHGREFTYTETVGSSEIKQTENINTTAVNFSGTILGAGAFAGASVFAGLGSLTGLGPTAEANAYAIAGAGKLSFDLLSVTTTRYTQTYATYLEVSNSFKQDMSIYPAGKRYAVAAFADIGVYQLLKYDAKTKTATSIPGKSLWFNVESEPVWDMYEYSPEEELSIPQQLKPFEQINVTVNEDDLYAALTKKYTESRSGETIENIANSSKDETYTPNLLINVLKQFGYTKLRIKVDFRYNAESIWGGTLRLQIANWNKSSEIARREFEHKNGWSSASSGDIDVPIDATGSETGQFMLLWSRVQDSGLWSEFRVGDRTITIEALK
jgi:hypothetical protein